MIQTANQSEPVRNQTDYPEDEIELIDLLRVIWKRKFLIIGGSLVCAIAAMVVSLNMPKIYRIETVLRPGILSIGKKGEKIFIDTPQNIKALIETGIFDNDILNSFGKPSVGHDPPLPGLRPREAHLSPHGPGLPADRRGRQRGGRVAGLGLSAFRAAATLVVWRSPLTSRVGW